MNDHSPDPAELQDAELTAFALGELEPGSERYAAVQSRLAEDEQARAYVDQVRVIGDELARQFAEAGETSDGLDEDQREAVVAAISRDQAPTPEAKRAVAGVIGPAPRFPRKALLAAGLALAAGAAITTAVLLNPNHAPDGPDVVVSPPPAGPDGPLAVVERMGTPVDVVYDRTPIAEAIGKLQARSQTPIRVDWDALHQRGIHRDTPITFKADQAPASAVLAMILQQAWHQSPHPDPVIWSVADAGLRVEPRSATVERRLADSRDAIAASNPTAVREQPGLFDLAPTVSALMPELFAISLTPSPEIAAVTQSSVQAELDQLIATHWDLPNAQQREMVRNALLNHKLGQTSQAVSAGRLALAERALAEAGILARGLQSRPEQIAQVTEQVKQLRARYAELPEQAIAQLDARREMMLRSALARQIEGSPSNLLALARLEAALAQKPEDAAVDAFKQSLTDKLINQPAAYPTLALALDDQGWRWQGVHDISGYQYLGESLAKAGEGLISTNGWEAEVDADAFTIVLGAGDSLAEIGYDALPRNKPDTGLIESRYRDRTEHYFSFADGHAPDQITYGLAYPDGSIDFARVPAFGLNKPVTNRPPGEIRGINGVQSQTDLFSELGRGNGRLGDNDGESIRLGLSLLPQRRFDRELPRLDDLDLEDVVLPEPVGIGDIFSIVNDNPFHMVFEQPKSTFSVDVDTAGYSIIRRQLTQFGTLPQPDQIRIEEMINYFNYSYQAPEVDAALLDNGVVTQAVIEQLEAADPGFAPFATHTEVTDCPWAEGHKLVRVGIKGMEVAMEDRPPAHLTFLLDVSGSMDSPDKLPLVKQSLKLLLEQLNPDDKVSIVVYAGASGLVLEPTEVADRNQIAEALDRLGAGGSTAGAAGIQLAYQVAQDHFIDGGVNRVILCTDGDFNVGISNSDALVELIKQKANPEADEDGVKRGVYFSAMGFGSGNLNDEMMERITNAGNGNYAYIDSLQEATRVMYDQAGATLVAIAKDVKIQVDFDPAQVLSYRLIGYENRLLATEDFEDDTVDAGDIGAGHTVTALYEVVPFDADWQDDMDSPAVQRRIEQLRGAIAMNTTLLQTTRLTQEQQVKLTAATGLLELELKQALAMSQRLAMSDRAAGVKRAPQRRGEPEPMLVVNLRYKPVDAPAEDGTSRLIEHPVLPQATAFDRASEDMRFAASVAGLGMALRKSPHFAGGGYDWIIDTARAASTRDPFGYRAQFITLAEKARQLSGGLVAEPEAGGE
ncbi:MAG: VWA domain-containing protein [Planctomycetota bacterium]